MKKTGGEVIVQKLVNEKVPYILGIPGHGVLGLFDAIRKAEAEGKINAEPVHRAGNGLR